MVWFVLLHLVMFLIELVTATRRTAGTDPLRPWHHQPRRECATHLHPLVCLLAMLLVRAYPLVPMCPGY